MTRSLPIPILPIPILPIPILPCLFLFAVLALPCLPAVATAAEPSLKKRVATFKKALRSKDPKTRARAFDYLRGVNNPDVVPVILGGMKKVVAAKAKIETEQKKAQATYAKSIDDLRTAQVSLEASGGTARDMKVFNKWEGRISKSRNAAVQKLKKLENDLSRNRSVLQQATLALSDSLEAMDEEALTAALALLTPAWLQASDVNNRLQFVDAVSELRRPVVTDILNTIVASEEQPTVVRVAAIDALAEREDGALFGKVLEMLKLPVEQQPFLITAIGVLRGMHDRRSIPALIAFLARTDLKRTRDDAYKALTSLTGLNHGKYAGEWKKWWDESGETFVLPKGPSPRGHVEQPDKGGTFYGIHTNSERILYIVDMSGSMDKAQKGKRGKTKWDVLKKELVGSVLSLDNTVTFNVIFFNHAVIRWQSRNLLASERNKKMLKKWVEAQAPGGGTNISDSLRAGFAIASAVKGRPALDTVFFLTDGKPTAGRTWDPNHILDIFREWNQTAKLTIHTIGIGADHDAAFMMELARIGDGTYVKR